MALIDLKMSKKDMAEEASPTADQSQYPWGACLNLDTDELKKLGIKDLPSVGDEYHIRAVGEVTSVSELDTGSGESKSLRIQITMMELVHEDESEAMENSESAADEDAENAERSTVMGKPKTILSNAYRGRS